MVRNSTGNIIVLFSVLLAIAGCSNPYDDWEYDPGPEDTIRYTVHGSAGIAGVITISNESNNTEQFTDVVLPWERQWTEYYSSSYDFLYVSAQNGTNSGTITTEIYLNGTLIETATSTGAYVIATASR